MQSNTLTSVLEEVKRFADSEIRPFAAEFDEKERIPRELIARMAERGYLGACFPKKYGGLELDPIEYGQFTEEIGKACSSTRALLTVHSSLVGQTLLRWGTDTQKKELLPAMATGELLASFALSEPEVGSDAKNVRTEYRRQGDHYLLNGRKKWITLSAIADLFLVIARSQEEITAFLVDSKTEGITVTPMSGLLANRAAYVAEIEFCNVAVPGKNVLGKEGSGFTYIVNTALDHGRYSVAWGGLGLAQEALESMVDYSRKRRQFGRRLHEYQFIQGMIGDAVTKIHAGRSLCMHAGKLRRDKHDDYVIETSIAKYYTSMIAGQIATDAVQVHGGNGCWNKYPAERLFREARVLEIIEGTTQMQQEVISAFGSNRYCSNKKSKL